MKQKLLPIFLSLLSFSAFATHERAGEITYKCLGGLKYEITVTTYTRGKSCAADRCFIQINFGDDTTHPVVYRTNGIPCPIPTSCGTAQPTCSFCGQMIGLPGDDVKMNKYVTTHTYPGPNTYTITVTDPNRNNDIVNIPGSSTGGTAFSIYSILVINPFFLPCNSSPALQNPPIDKACAGNCFIHNPGAVDPDGDSLSYQLGVCFEDVATPIQGYFIPAGVSVNSITGDFTWCNPPPPTATGTPDHPDCDEYNFAIDIFEWRKVNGNYVMIGAIRRDMQVTVCNCQNKPPIIANVDDTCILANTNLTFTVTAQDQGGNDIQSFTATGGPFSTTPPATFSSDVPPQQNIATGIFSWTPACNQVRKFPYLVTLKATDDGAPDNIVFLSDYESFFITVIAPAPQNLTAAPSCTKMILNWNAELCNPSTNGLLGYRIYRKVGCDTLKPGYCDTGMPSSWGYSLIGTVAYNKTTYTDVNNLSPGVFYSYRVVAYFYDGAESYVSNPACNKLVRDVPIITNVDVKSTSTTIGVINIKWVKPLADPANFDTTLSGNNGPYKFELYRGIGNAIPATLVHTFSSPYFALLDSTYLDSFLNTENSAYTYRVDFFFNGNTTACGAQSASSVFLSCNPNDNQIQITWNETVPWINSEYDIYRFNGTMWDSIGTTSLQTFTDTGLANGSTYCYKVKSIGAFPDTTLPHPLTNWSQELCCIPIDKTPPCPLSLVVDSSCEFSQNLLLWNNPNNSCCDDALYYIIYNMPVEDGDFSLLDTVNDINTTSYLHDSLTSIAGCYAVTAVDSFGNQSAYSNVVCVDNCPQYELPNVFTPNGDGTNDFFTPLHPYKYVKDIDIKIYNRWGTEVFRTTDPEILWDGKSAQTKMMCSDGVYYYVCIVNEIRLKGIIPHALTGYVHLLSNK